MKMMSFLAGVATGVLLNQYLGRGATTSRQQGARLTGDSERNTASDENYPMRLMPRTDEQIRERIQSQVGRTIGNPEAVQVEVSGGNVTLRGKVQARDSILLMTEVESTTGVTSVQNLLDIEGSLDEVAPPMTRDKPAVRAAERATSHMS
jgi:hypothetical protein